MGFAERATKQFALADLLSQAAAMPALSGGAFATGYAMVKRYLCSTGTFARLAMLPTPTEPDYTMAKSRC